MQPRRSETRRAQSVAKIARTNHLVAVAVGIAALPWLAAGEPALFSLGLIACLAAGVVAWLPELGRPAVIGCGFFAAAAITCHPLLAGSWHPWQSFPAGEWNLAGAALVCLPCLLMVVSRTWALDLLSDDLSIGGEGCENQADDVR